MRDLNHRPPPSDALVLFGVTGDLARKMIFPALYAMVERGVLTVPVVGVASTPWKLAQLRERATDSIDGVPGHREAKCAQTPPLARSICARKLQ